jgi:hypothetical protein
MRARLLFATFLLAAALHPAAARGQDAAYARAPGDTLRYREVTRSTLVIRPPERGREMRTRGGHDAVLAIAFEPGGRAQAWYESLRISRRRGWFGSARPATAAALGRPFVLRFGERGEVETLSAPVFPPSFQGVADLTRQFEDYFLRLPGGALTPGREWADTVALPSEPGAGLAARWKAARYRVRGDSVVDGHRVAVVEYETSMGPFPSAGLHLGGGARGVAFFSPATGRFVGREEEGRWEGQVLTNAGYALGYTFTYTSTIRLLTAPPPSRRR